MVVNFNYRLLPPFKFLMESYRFIGKLARWAHFLQEYDFDIIHKVSRVNQDADGLSWNQSYSEEDTIAVQWHGDINLEVVPRWHVSTYFVGMLWGCTLGRTKYWGFQKKRYQTRRQWCFIYMLIHMLLHICKPPFDMMLHQ